MKGPGILGALLRLPPPARRAAVEAAVLLALARVLVSFVPMRRWRRWLNAAPADAGGDPAGRRTLGREVGGIVQRVAVRLPFRAACLPQAMAAQWMLRRRGVSSRLTFGVRRAPGQGGGPEPAPRRPPRRPCGSTVPASALPRVAGGGRRAGRRRPGRSRPTRRCPRPRRRSMPAPVHRGARRARKAEAVNRGLSSTTKVTNQSR